MSEDSYLSIDWETEWGLVAVPGFSFPIMVAVDLELYNNVAGGSIDGTLLNLDLSSNLVGEQI